MGLGEADTRAKLIDPALRGRGWTEDLIRREETAGAVEVVNGRPRRRARGRVDYTLRVKVSAAAQPVAVALIEAKAEDLPPGHGLEQVKLYGACERLAVRFVFASNGHRFVEFDRTTGLTSQPRPLAEFPSPAELRARYEAAAGVRLDSDAARPLVTPGGFPACHPALDSAATRGEAHTGRDGRGSENDWSCGTCGRRDRSSAGGALAVGVWRWALKTSFKAHG
jgi:type I restriction enzyme R subunit